MVSTKIVIEKWQKLFSQLHGIHIMLVVIIVYAHVQAYAHMIRTCPDSPMDASHTHTLVKTYTEVISRNQV